MLMKAHAANSITCSVCSKAATLHLAEPDPAHAPPRLLPPPTRIQFCSLMGCCRVQIIAASTRTASDSTSIKPEGHARHLIGTSGGSRPGCLLANSTVSCICSRRCQGTSAYTSVNMVDSGFLGTHAAASSASSTCLRAAVRSAASSPAAHHPCPSIHALNRVTGSRDRHDRISSAVRYRVESSDVEWCPLRYDMHSISIGRDSAMAVSLAARTALYTARASPPSTLTADMPYMGPRAATPSPLNCSLAGVEMA
mmetsp:Transcript_13782/g.33895  ORF Transcript_13782/g.33895 Transcript_13782/m.33895 type:complete len:254 (+) Transcript_13782:208-969(+)